MYQVEAEVIKVHSSKKSVIMFALCLQSQIITRNSSVGKLESRRLKGFNADTEAQNFSRTIIDQQIEILSLQHVNENCLAEEGRQSKETTLEGYDYYDEVHKLKDIETDFSETSKSTTPYLRCLVD